jgi:hypothetical protein
MTLSCQLFRETVPLIDRSLANNQTHISTHIGTVVIVGELDYPTWFPSRSYQLEWLSLYLNEFNRLQGQELPTDSQVSAH